MKKMLLFFCGLFLAALVQGQIIHVPADYSTIQLGINAATPGDTVLVAEGTYDEQINFLGKKPLVVASQFLMDGNTSHISNTIIDRSQPTNPDSASVVYFVSGEDTTSILCGFTIRNGKGTLYAGPSNTYRAGGGVFISSSGAKIIHNHITENNLNITLHETTNIADGGGIGCEWNTDNRWVVVSDNLIDYNSCTSENVGASGAGISICYNSRITGNTISDNTCTGTGTAYAVSAGFDCENYSTSFNLINVLIQHNIIKSNHVTTETSYASAAGGIISGANAVFSENEIINNVVNTGSTSGGNIIGFYNPRAGCIARNNVFRENTTNRFGTLGAETDEGLAMNMILFENNYFIDNNAVFGGAISVINAPAIIQNNVFSGNNATQKGGAVYIRPGNDISTEHMVTFINNSFFGNKSPLGGAIYAFGSTDKPLIINSVFWGDTVSAGSEIYLSSSADTVEISYSNINPALIYGHYRDGGNNINTDPLFTDLVTLTISPLSPVFNTGTISYTCACGDTHTCPQYDLLGMPRPWDTSPVDMGAYEWNNVGIDDLGIRNSDCGIAAYPNPFSGTITFDYKLTEASQVKLSVYDNFGQLVAEPVNSFQQKGVQKVNWDAGNLPAGIYFYRIITDTRQATGRMILVK